MAALTINSADGGQNVRILEALSITNGVGAGVRKRALKVPDGQRHLSFYLYLNSMTGTSPLVDFVVGIPDFSTDAKMLAPTDDNERLFGDSEWNGITQVTGAGPYLHIVSLGPDEAATADDTGSATADSYYAVRGELPPWLTYTITTDATTGDEDYDIGLVAVFKR